MKDTITVITTILLFSQIALALNNGLALTPPMGWNTWNRFGCNTDCQNNPDTCVSEKLIMETADAMVSSGLKDLGYEYINLDDCWLAKTRDANGRLQPDPSRFPSGIKALADYVHSKGLKFGIYEDSGNETCGGYPGSEGWEGLDLETFAEWGVDYLKLDGCYLDAHDMKYVYTLWSRLLIKTGRPMIFSCSWPAYADEGNMPIDMEYVGEICNLWREWYDITDSWNAIMQILPYQNHLQPYAGPGKWNDPDMLEVGNGGMTFEEYKSHFSLWAILAAPLVIGTDIRKMSNETITILSNKEIIDVDQDPAGLQGSLVHSGNNNTQQVWARSLANPKGGSAAVLFNSDDHNSQTVTVYWRDLGYSPDSTCEVRDLWLHKDMGTAKRSYSATVPSHGVVMIRVTNCN